MRQTGLTVAVLLVVVISAIFVAEIASRDWTWSAEEGLTPRARFPWQREDTENRTAQSASTQPPPLVGANPPGMLTVQPSPAPRERSSPTKTPATSAALSPRPSAAASPAPSAVTVGVAAKPSPGALYIVQVAVVTTRAEAQEAVVALQRNGLQPYVVATSGGFAVRLGAFRRPEGAAEVLRQARARGVAAVIIRQQ